MKIHRSEAVIRSTDWLSDLRAPIRAAIGKGALILLGIGGMAGCFDSNTTGGGDTPVDPPQRILTSVHISLPVDTIEINQIVTPNVEGFDQFGQPITIQSPSFAARGPLTVVVGAETGLIFAVKPGTVDIIATVNGVIGHVSLTVVKAAVRINEVFTNGDIPGGFVELVNPTDKDIDLGGYSVTTLDTLNFVALPAGFIIPAHGYTTVNEINFPLGIGASGAVRLFSRFDALLDQFSWVGIPATDFSRCPELNGPFLASFPTRRAINNCVDAQDIRGHAANPTIPSSQLTFQSPGSGR